jgi:hypothetical protein
MYQFPMEALLDAGGRQYGLRCRDAGLAEDGLGLLVVPDMVGALTLTADGIKAIVQYTRAPLQSVVDGYAEWEDWSLGEIDGTGVATTASEYLTPQQAETVTAFRVVMTTFAGTYDIYAYGAQGADRAGRWITPEGGTAELKTWDAASAAPSVKGELVSFNDPGEVALAVAGADLPYTGGVVYDSDCPPGGIVPVVVHGDADLLLVNATPSVIAQLASLSTTVDGRTESVAPPVAATWSEYSNWIGVFKEANAGGVDQLVRVALKF